jgi:hypothetical protein
MDGAQHSARPGVAGCRRRLRQQRITRNIDYRLAGAPLHGAIAFGKNHCGGVLLVLGTALFLYMMPRNGMFHRFVGTELEPYIGVAFTAATAIALTLILSGAIDVWG